MVRISLIGITHIDKESQDKVTDFLLANKPEAVCLELDEYRLNILLQNEYSSPSEELFTNEKNDIEQIEESQKKDEEEEYSNSIDSFQLGNFTSILEDIGFFESRLANILKTDQPGLEMLLAYKAAREIGAEIYLIDRSIYEINKAMEEEISKEEAQNFQKLVDELLFDRNIVSESIDKKVHKGNNNSNNSLMNLDENQDININEVFEIFKDQEALSEILGVFSSTFPKLFSVLLQDRNEYMIAKITDIAKKHNDIAVILGYGHVKDVAEGLKDLKENFELVILSE